MDTMNKIYNAASYVRLSRDDNNDKSESNSITNQKEIIREYVKNHKDIHIVNEYIDDGYSGSNFERPGFKKMIEDIEAEKIDCIVTKDLSRFSRNYIDGGKYIENIFPYKGIRFISINDSYDTCSEYNNNDSILIPFKNLINDYYCRDISQKIKSSLDIKRKKGDFISSFTVYGYKKDKDNKNKLILDDYACEIVKQIFNYKISGMNNKAIADKLNENGILSPAEYKTFQGLNYKSGLKIKKKSIWSANAISNILNNPIYIGTLEQGKRRKLSYSINKIIKKNPSEWIVLKDNHEPIISKKVFENVQEIIKNPARTAPQNNTVYPLSGKLFCADCGYNLVMTKSIKHGIEYSYYMCSANRINKNCCTSHRINENKLIDCIVSSIRSYINQTLDIENMLENINKLFIVQNGKDINILNKQLKISENELDIYKEHIKNLFEGYSKKIIDEKDFNEFNDFYKNEYCKTEKNINKIKDKINKISDEKTDKFLWIKELKQYKGLKKLNRNAVVIFINKIIVHEKNQIEIVYNHLDDYNFTVNFINDISKL